MTTPTPTDADTRRDRVRCSDRERDRAAETVHEAAGTGRLTLDEAGDRTEEVLRARYRDELEALTADLPGPAPVAAGWAAVWATLSAQILVEAAILTGRTPGGVGRRLLALLVFLGPVLLLLGGGALVLHALLDGGGPGPGPGPLGGPGPRGR